MTSERQVHGWCGALRAMALLGLLGAAACSAATATAPPSALLMPSALPPLTVGIDSLDCALRIDLHPQAGTAVHPDNRLQLSMSLPLQGALLRIRSVTLSRLRSDSGEYLALVVRPPLHEQHLTAESPANRERVLRIPCVLSPPFRPCTRLFGLSGAMTVVMAQGTPVAALVSARIGASADCAQLGAVSIVERTAHGWQLRIPDALADQLAEVVGIDAAGVELVSHTHPVTFADGGVATEVDCDLASCANVRISWYPAVTTSVIPIAIPEIAVPGGLTTIGTLDLGPESAAAPALDAAVLQDPLNLAVAHHDARLVESLLAHGAAIDAVDADGRCALVRAIILDDAALVRVLLAHHPALAPDAVAQSPLAAALARGSLPLIAQLLAAGADPYALLPDGTTCVDKAMTLERWRALSLMLGNPVPKRG